VNRRVTGIIAAAVLAVIGTVTLSSYVQSARDSAEASVGDVEVWIVDDTIAKGTSGADIADHVTRTKVPRRLEADGALKDLDAIDDLVAIETLLPGDQVVSSRFGTPAQVRQAGIPAGLHAVTLELEPQRALGGQLRAGDKVDVVMSYDLTSDAARATGATKSTGVTLRDVLVASVQINPNAEGVPDVEAEAHDEDDAAVTDAPTESLLVTLAVDAPSVERLILGAEFGKVWLATSSTGAAK
jgi:pilus assembly protein CpaB